MSNPCVTEAQLYAFINPVAKELGLDPQTIIIAPSEDVNAFANGFMNMIVVTEGLLEICTEKEVYAVLVHEIAHTYHRHYAARMALNAGRVLFTGVNLFLPLPIWKKLLLEMGASIVFTGLQIPLFHKQEYQADELTFRYGLNQDLATSLLKFEDAKAQSFNKSYGFALPGWATVFGRLTHPATEDRVKILSGTVINA